MRNALIDIVAGIVAGFVMCCVMSVVMSVVKGGDVVWGHELRACPPHF